MIRIDLSCFRFDDSSSVPQRVPGGDMSRCWADAPLFLKCELSQCDVKGKNRSYLLAKPQMIDVVRNVQIRSTQKLLHQILVRMSWNVKIPRHLLCQQITHVLIGVVGKNTKVKSDFFYDDVSLNVASLSFLIEWVFLRACSAHKTFIHRLIVCFL